MTETGEWTEEKGMAWMDAVAEVIRSSQRYTYTNKKLNLRITGGLGAEEIKLIVEITY